MKNIFKIIFLLIIFSFFINSNKLELNFIENEPYDYPKIELPDEKEKEGIKLKITLPEYFFTNLCCDSKEYKNIVYLKAKKKYKIKEIKLDDRGDYFIITEWYKEYINELDSYIIKSNKSKESEAIFCDKNNKPIKIIRNLENGTKTDYTLLDNSKYYIPDKEIKIGDEWEFDFFDISEPLRNNKKENPKYYEIKINSKFKLLGYINYNNTRCALIESIINCEKMDIYYSKQSSTKKKGGAVLYNITMNNLLYLDYENEKVIFVKSFIKQVARGNYFENWGNTLQEVKVNIKKSYVNKINGDSTFIRQFFYNYNYNY